MIRLARVSVTYPGRSRSALTELSLEISCGQRVAVMGANGSGKSTLALLLAGLLKPSSGTLHIELSSGEKPGPHAALVFQNPENQMVATIVEKELAFALENQAVSQKQMEEQVEKTAQVLSITHLLNASTNKLSGGEQQKVALGSVMITNPPLLILDEPDAFLDAQGRVALANALENVREQNSQLIEIRITQEIETARSYDRVIALFEGKVVVDNTPEQVFAQAEVLKKCGIVASDVFPTAIGSGLTNMFEGRSAASADKIILDELSFQYPSSGRPIFKSLGVIFSRGEIVGLAGPTGSGKSTLGLMLAGILRPTSGSISFLPTEKHGHTPVTMSLQLPERQFFLPTCREEIAFGPSNMGLPLTEGDIDAMLDSVGLAAFEFSRRNPHSLSIGEQRRLAFAVVLALGRPFIVFDEPTAGLDAEGIARFIHLQTQLKVAGTGQIVISHDHTFLTRVADRILTLDGQGGIMISSPNQLLPR